MPTGKKALTGSTQRRVNNVELLMFQAAKQGKTSELELVLELPKADQCINYQDHYGQTPLMIAAKNGHFGCVKLLLARGASLRVSTHRGGQEVMVWQLAKRANHAEVATYLQRCLADIDKIGTTRAQLEYEVNRIASCSSSTVEELELFSTTLQRLITHCDYELNSHESLDGDTHIPLLIRATKSNNVKIVLKLIHEFGATPLINELGTGHNILHLACLQRSDLRYYIAKRYPHLLRNPDSGGAVPLHLACTLNDLDFVKWLFAKILAEESEMDQFCMRCESELKRANSLPDITKGKPRKKSTSFRRKINRQSELCTPVNILSPMASLPVHRLTHRRVKSGGNLDMLDSDSTSHESSPLDLREAGLTFSFDDSVARSHTISLTGSSRSHSSIENSLESRSLRDSADCHSITDSRSSRESSANPELESDGREDATPLPSLQNGFANGHALSEEAELLGLEEILSEPPLSVNEVVEMKPFRVDMRGDTILHILPREGHNELLGNVLKVADYIKRSVDFGFLTHRDGHGAHLPIEEAICAKKTECVRLLIHFAIVCGFFEQLLSDRLVLKNAVFTSAIEIVMVLIEFGFTAGLGPAIALAMVSEYQDILRLLLFYHTQVINSLEFTKMTRNRQITLDKGGINWDGLQLDHVIPVWLYDSYDAVDSVSRVFDLEPIFNTPEGNSDFYCRLGQACLRFFNDRPHSATRSIRPLTLITEINLSSNLLSEVPCELFQMSSLQVLKLSHNELAALPSSEDLSETIYTSPIQRLELDWNKLVSLPEDLFRGVASSLEELNAECNHLKDLPPGMWVCPKLKVLKLSRNKLSRLHYLSDPRYFIDFDLTKQVSSCFTSENAKLTCTLKSAGLARKKELDRTRQYIQRLASYYLTALSAQNSSLVNRDVYQEVIGMHVARHIYYHHTEEGAEVTEAGLPVYQNAQLLLPGDEEDDSEVCSMSHLEMLDLSLNRFQEMPWDLVCIAPKLNKLDLHGNMLADTDIIHSMPLGLKSLILDTNKIMSLERHRPVSLPCGDPLRLLTLPEENFGSKYCRHCRHEVLNSLTNLSLEHNKLESFPIVDVITDNTHDPDLQVAYDIGTINYLVFYPNLSILSLEHNQFAIVPPHLHHLTHLSSLSISHNDIHKLPPEMGLINSQQLLLLKMQGLFLKNIPENLLNRPTPKHLLSYLKALLQKSKPYRRIKLMVVGDANKGKTSLLLNLTRKGRINRLKDVAMGVNNVPLATVGVDLGDWEYTPNPKSKPKVTFMTWDFGGQAEYYATHQCFLTKRSLYVLVWDVQDGEEGLLSLRPWLENIEGRAPESPVFVIATHLDKLPLETRTDVLKRLKQHFRDQYINCSGSVYMYPRIHPECFFINCYDPKHMDSLRDFLYDFVTHYKAPAPRHLIKEMDPLLEQPIPASYMVLEDIVRSLADQCKQRQINPIFTKQDFISAVKDHEAGYYEKLEELEQATHFLHDNGILLHYEDSNLLSDLYFVDPQWLCSMLAKVVTVQERNPFQKNGFMPVDNLCKIFPSFVDEFIMLMHRFEVVLLLDRRRMLIPSLLPNNEEDSIVIFLRSVSDNLLDKKLSQQSLEAREEEGFPGPQEVPHAPLCQTPYFIFSRYYLLPFVPNGFFTRVIARLMSTEIMDHLHNSLLKGHLEDGHVLNAAHWRCWRDGISIIWSHMEIFRIAPVRYPLLGTNSTILVSNSGEQEVRTVRGVEIKVALLPEESVTGCTMIPDGDSKVECSKGRCVATWLLDQAITIVDSVFEDWYEAFSKKKGFELSAIRTGSPCKSCFRTLQTAEVKASATPLQRRLSTFSMSYDVINRWSMEDKALYLFTTTYCSLALEEGFPLQCPLHGEVTVAEVAPDLMFSDFPSCKVFTDPCSIVIKRVLGDGGFGTVYKATLKKGDELLNVAVKQFRTEMAYLEQDPVCLRELKSWDVYQKASQEARVMLPLQHSNILALIGLTFQPLRLVVELAPLGDLKSCVKKFKKAKVRLSRSTLQQTLIQTAEGLRYLHSKRFIYRDLKPDNILVWQFPTPESQWSIDSCVCIKIADYGISKQVTPQGIRGVEGTRPYLAPEVILHGGREAYSSLMDVYAYGMFMYYLMSFMTPFETETRPITALLEEGRRPELSLKLRPHSLHMFELMCWCWSDLPQHRPNFDQILEIVKMDTFTSLLAATAITGESEDITASSLHTIRARRNSLSYHQNRSMANICTASLMNIDLSMSHSNAVSFMTGSAGEELTTQVWYGTQSGICGLVQFQRSGIIKEDIVLPSKKKKFVSDIAVINKNVWFCTVGMGIWVYDTLTHQLVGTWGEDEKQQIYTLLEIKETSSVLALTHKGMYVFDSDLGLNSPLFTTLLPRVTIPRSGMRDVNVGVVIPPGGNIKHTEVWVCSQTVFKFYILDTKDLGVVEEVNPPTTEKQSHKIRHMTTIMLSDRRALVVADRHFLQFWDVATRRREREVDCVYACRSIYGDNSRNSRVTSLLSRGDFLYVGTGGGAILVLDSVTMSPHKVLHAYTKPVRSLLLIQPDSQSPPIFKRMFSRKDNSAKISPRVGTLPSRGSMNSIGSSSSTQSMTGDCSDRAVLVSLGVAYKGVIGDAENHPSMLILPSDGAKLNTKLAKVPKHYGHLLLWSAETISTGSANTAKECDCTVDLPNLSEEELEDSLFGSGD